MKGLLGQSLPTNQTSIHPAKPKISSSTQAMTLLSQTEFLPKWPSLGLSLITWIYRRYKKVLWVLEKGQGWYQFHLLPYEKDSFLNELSAKSKIKVEVKMGVAIDLAAVKFWPDPKSWQQGRDVRTGCEKESRDGWRSKSKRTVLEGRQI